VIVLCFSDISEALSNSSNVNQKVLKFDCFVAVHLTYLFYLSDVPLRSIKGLRV